MALPSGIYLQYKADALVGYADGDLVNTWNDSSGNGRHATGGGGPSGAAVGGIYKLNILGGKPCVQFPGGARSYTLPDLSSLTAGEVFILWKITNINGGYNFGSGFAGGNLYPYNDGNIYDNFGSTSRHDAIPPAVPVSEFHVYNVSSIAGEWIARHNATILRTEGNTVGFSATPYLGDSGSALTVGYVAEVILYSRKLTSPERADVLAYFNGKYYAPVITLTSLPNVSPGDDYSQTLAATGGTGAKTWSLASGSLPGGLTLSSAGVISGSTTGPEGLFGFTVTVTDATGASDTKPFTITVTAYTGPPRFPSPNITGIIWEHFEQVPIDYSKTTVTHVYEDEGRSFNETTTTPAIRWDVTFTGLSFDESAIFENFARSVRLTVPFTFKDKYGVTWADVRVDTYERSHSRNMSWCHNVHFVLVKYP